MKWVNKKNPLKKPSFPSRFGSCSDGWMDGWTYNDWYILSKIITTQTTKNCMREMIYSHMYMRIVGRKTNRLWRSKTCRIITTSYTSGPPTYLPTTKSKWVVLGPNTRWTYTLPFNWMTKHRSIHQFAPTKERVHQSWHSIKQNWQNVSSRNVGQSALLKEQRKATQKLLHTNKTWFKNDAHFLSNNISF
jgi:hypothetical protein